MRKSFFTGFCFTCDQPDVIHDHEVKGEELHRGCGVQQLPSNKGGIGQGGVEVQGTHQKETDCGELVGYVDDGAY